VLNDTLKKYFAGQKGIIAVYLFGSHAKKKSHAKSDIDLAILFDKNTVSKALDRSLKITCDLMKLLNRDKVDIVTLNTANPILKNQVYKYGFLLFCKDPIEVIRFKARTFLEYLDIQPVRRICEIAIKQRTLNYGR